MPFCIIYTTVYSRVADALAKILKHDYLSKASKMKAASAVVNSIKRRKEHLPIMHCGNYSHFWLLSSIDTISTRHRRDSRLCQTSYGSSPSFWYTKGGPLPGMPDGWKKVKWCSSKLQKNLPLPSLRVATRKKKVKAVAFFRHLKKNTKSSYRAYGQRSLLGSKQHLVAEWKKHKHFGCEWWCPKP